MYIAQEVAKMTRRRILGTIGSVLPVFVIYRLVADGQDKSGLPYRYDAVQAAPNGHKVIFENALVRVLEVILPPPRTTEPMHHHRWPSFFLSGDKGGKTPHVRYLRPDGYVRDEPSENYPLHPGRWAVQWMKPEPMHAIQVVDRPQPAPAGPPLPRIEIKFRS